MSVAGSGARRGAVAASRFDGIAASRASTARLSPKVNALCLVEKATCHRTTARSYLSLFSVGEQERQFERFCEAHELKLGRGCKRLRDVAAIEGGS
jgi:hypothetical protein